MSQLPPPSLHLNASWLPRSLRRQALLPAMRGLCRGKFRWHTEIHCKTLHNFGTYVDYVQGFESAETTCLCDHTWVAHTSAPGSSAQNSLFARGGTPDGRCAGFWSTDPVWTMRSICVCGLPWYAHTVLVTAIVASTAAPVTPAAPAAAAASTSTTSTVPDPAALAAYRHAPTVAFAGFSRPSTASIQHTRTTTVRNFVQAERRDAIQRHLHSNDAGSSTSRSVATTPTTGKRKSGPPRPYSQPIPALSALNDFAPPRPVVTSATMTVGILPKVLHTSAYHDALDPSPSYSWDTPEALEKAQLALQAANLVFTVEVPLSGAIFQAMDEGFRTHCRIHNFHFVRHSSEAPETPNNLSWLLLARKKSKGTLVWVEEPKGLTRYTFTLHTLRGVPFSHTANNLREGPFAFIAVRCNNMSGPIDSLFAAATLLPEHVLVHGCLARRVCHKIIPALEDEPEPQCGADCPTLDIAHHSTPRATSANLFNVGDSDDDDDFPEPANIFSERNTPASPTPARAASPIMTRAIRRQRWEQEAAAAAAPVAAATSVAPTVVMSEHVQPFVPGPLLAAAMDISPLSVKSRSFAGPEGILDLTLQHMPGSGAISLARWQKHMQTPHEMRDFARIRASSIDEGARTLIAASIWLFAGRPAGLKLKEILQEQFPSPRPNAIDANRDLYLFGLQVTIGLASGPGPRNEVVTEAIKILLADQHFWTERETYHCLRLHPVRTGIPARACVLKASGLLFLLHFLFIGAPASVSPFLFSTLFDGRNTATKFDEEFLANFISPPSFAIIKKIAQTPLTSPLYVSTSDLEYQYLVNIPDVDPTMISNRRSKDEHDGVCATLISYVSLGAVDLEHHPDFQFVGDGFNVILDPFADQGDTEHHVLEWFATPCRHLLLAAFNGKIKTPADVVAHLEFSQTNPEHDPWGENEEIVGLITRFVTHYLMEPGHPVDRDQVLQALIGDAGGADGAILRSSLFLSVLSGSSMLPVNPEWKLQCQITHDWSEDYCTIEFNSNGL
ncbi:hypothetical protein C8R46DRAFT_1284188 [Mycena filopes]|nr:hypothetical protein C8R46DRAFT_1284188 [Mycena filopes]